MSRHRSLVATLLVAAAFGCGHTEEEMAQKDRRIRKLTADLRQVEAQLSDDKVTFEQTADAILKLHDEVQRLDCGLVRGVPH